jgi:hypothetical protein
MSVICRIVLKGCQLLCTEYGLVARPWQQWAVAAAEQNVDVSSLQRQ